MKAANSSPDPMATPAPVRERSRFYNLEPIGVGTRLQEALSSYVSRFAGEYVVRPKVFVEVGLQPLMDECVSPAALLTSLHGINGHGRKAKRYVAALEKGTCREDLSRATMLPWRHLVSSQLLLRQEQAWCPACYENWHQHGQEPYQPLLWLLEPVLICPTHEQLLVTRCPACNRTVPIVDPKPGYCAHPDCGRWLGDAGSGGKPQHSFSTYDIERFIWYAQELGTVLALSPEKFLSLDIRTSMARYRVRCFFADDRLATEILPVPKARLEDWTEGRSLPPLHVILGMCYLFRLPLLRFLRGAIGWDHYLTSDGFGPNRRQNRTTRGQKDLVPQLQELELVKPPMPLNEAARRLGCSVGFLKKHHPGWAAKIVHRYRQYRTRAHLTRIKAMCDEIEKVVDLLVKERQYPSLARVVKTAGIPIWTRNKQAYATWKDAKRRVLEKASQP